MEPIIKKIKINQLLNFFGQMCININHLFTQALDGKKEVIIYTKQENEKFTNYDWAIQKMIENHLYVNFKDIKFIGEENTKEEVVKPDFSRFLSEVDEITFSPFSEEFVGDINEKYAIEDLCIYCDPIDSTSSFIKKNYGPVTTLVGITHKGSPVCGLIHFPLFEGKIPKTFLNIPGKGIFTIDVTKQSEPGEYSKIEYSVNKIEIPRTDNFNFCITATRENPTMNKVMSLFPGYEVVRVSGLGNKAIVALIKNYFYFAPSKGLGFWDICAPHALMKEVGGDCVYVTGEKITYPENYTDKTLKLSMCMSPDNEKLTKFVDALKENKIEL